VEKKAERKKGRSLVRMISSHHSKIRKISPERSEKRADQEKKVPFVNQARALKARTTLRGGALKWSGVCQEEKDLQHARVKPFFLEEGKNSEGGNHKKASRSSRKKPTSAQGKKKSIPAKRRGKETSTWLREQREKKTDPRKRRHLEKEMNERKMLRGGDLPVIRR